MGAWQLKPKRALVVALAGTPNVGKSAIFHQITGADVIVSNYPGTTVELTEGKVKHGKYDVRVVDLPGIYSLGAVSDDEMVARRAILEQTPDVIVNIVDASTLGRSLYLTLQFLELGYPMIVVLNMQDIAMKKGIKIDSQLLSRKLGVPVVSTVAIRGENVRSAFDKAIEIATKKIRPQKVIPMGKDLERSVMELDRSVRKNFVRVPLGLPSRAIAVKLLEGDAHLTEALAYEPRSEAVLKKADKLAKVIKAQHGEPAAFRIARERHGIASIISKESSKYVTVKPTLSEKLSETMAVLKTGVPIMIAVFVALILLIVYVGGFLENLLVGGWRAATFGLSSALQSSGAVGQVVNIGLIQGTEGILVVMIPYILVFFLALAILEDTGYLPRMAFIMDSAMHKIGLHGRAVVPMLGGFGCNVPAIMGTRVLTTKRERRIASFLITMIPCSARTAIILGTVGFFLGMKYVLVIYGIILAMIFIVGWLLNRWLPGEVSGMIMEIPPLRRPMLAPVLYKTWLRMKHFFYMAVPLLLLGSFLIGILHVSGALNSITGPLSPFTTGLLGLPAITIIPLIYGFIRKEGALVLLVSIAGTSNLLTLMNPLQIFVFALVVAIYIPCIATVAILKRELGWKDAIAISAGTFLIAVAAGSLVYHLNPFGL
jgi:ferrous iron transport protein B